VSEGGKTEVERERLALLRYMGSGDTVREEISEDEAEFDLRENVEECVARRRFTARGSGA
jgi:hypothetical protein